MAKEAKGNAGAQGPRKGGKRIMIGGIIGIIVILVSGIILFSMSRIEKYPLILPETLKELSYNDLYSLYKDVYKEVKKVPILKLNLKHYQRLYLNFITIQDELKKREQTIGHRQSGSGYKNASGRELLTLYIDEALKMDKKE